MEFTDQLSNRVRAFEEYMESNLLNYTDGQDILAAAMNYALSGGGKRLRPIIMLASARMMGAEEKVVLPFALALEMIHTYSLVHDDLPAMDNDDMRRGRKTTHIVYGEDIAILAGDALLNRSFEIMTEAIMGMDAQQKRGVIAMMHIAKSAGGEGMVGGQTIDLISEDKCIDLEKLRTMDALKTGAIIRAAGIAGAVLAGATQEQIECIDRYCLNLGIAFQIQDDILDVEGDSVVFGKPVGSDAGNKKSTYVSIFGIEDAKNKMLEYTDNAVAALKHFGESGEFLSQLAFYLIKREK